MARILISWVAKNMDFIKGEGKPDPNGPNSLVHKHLYKYDYHILLSDKTASNDLSYEVLVNYLLSAYKHDIREMYMNIKDVIDVKEIKAKIEKLLLDYRKDEIEIFISPGTPSMQVAWYLAHVGLGLKTKLFQTRPSKYSKNNIFEKLYVDIEKSSITSSFIIKESILNDNENKDILITNSLKPIYKIAEKVAATNNVPVLILGETGTGKEKLARFIHEKSHRVKEKFIAINCAALGDQLLESRLFGYVKGAFTGAIKETKGYFQNASGGTIFLDEIGDVTPYMQQTLLRVLQEKKITKVGSTEEENVDVRIIAATNKDLIKLCNENKFRRDLYYRLSVVDLTLPSLRDIGTKEIAEIFNFIIEKKTKEFNIPSPIFSKQLKNQLLLYPFPGNIRELENLIERLFALVEGNVTENSLPKNFSVLASECSFKLRDIARDHINKVYLMCNKNTSKTAKVLNISINTVKKNLRN